MRKIFAIGETVYDIIFRDAQPVAAKAGGSMLNSSVSLGRLNLPVYFISEFGTDHAGRIINDFLVENNVSDKYIYRYSDGKTALSLAMLNEQGDADFSFYKTFPDNRLDILMPEIERDDIVMFGSFFAVSRDVRSKLLEIINHAKSQNAIIFYDPNFRKPHLDQLRYLKDHIVENISLSHLVRGSDEDFRNIFNCKDAYEAYRKIESCGCNNLIYTANKDGVCLYTKNHQLSFGVQQIDPLSTIGAGDSFNAGVVSSLYDQNVKPEELGRLPVGKWNKIIKRGIEFGTHVCLNYDNYISRDFAQTYTV